MTVQRCRHRALLWALPFFCSLAAAIASGPLRAETEVDLQLVLAVDASGSVDDAEYRLQLSGIALALRDDSVLEAIAGGVQRRIVVALMVWAESNYPKDFSDWHLIEDRASAERFAAEVEHFPRRVVGGTGIGGALLSAARRFKNNGFSGWRRVIDLSGDGRETTPRDYRVDPAQGLAAARSRGVTVNALAILSDEPDLETYYRDHIIGGPGAFAMAVTGYGDFADAMRRKLLREIRYRPDLSRLP